MTYDMKIYEIRVNPSELDRIKSAFVSNNMQVAADKVVSDPRIERGKAIFYSPDRLRLEVKWNFED